MSLHEISDRVRERGTAMLAVVFTGKPALSEAEGMPVPQSGAKRPAVRPHAVRCGFAHGACGVLARRSGPNDQLA